MVEFAEDAKRIARMTQNHPSVLRPTELRAWLRQLYRYNSACLINMMETFKKLLGYDTSGLSFWFHVRRWKRHANQSPDLVHPEGVYLRQ